MATRSVALILLYGMVLSVLGRAGMTVEIQQRVIAPSEGDMHYGPTHIREFTMHSAWCAKDLPCAPNRATRQLRFYAVWLECAERVGALHVLIIRLGDRAYVALLLRTGQHRDLGAVCGAGEPSLFEVAAVKEVQWLRLWPNGEDGHR